METQLFQLTNGEWHGYKPGHLSDPATAQLVLCFAAKSRLNEPGVYEKIREQFPAAQISICSTAGEILQDKVQDDSLVAVAMQFAHTTIKTAAVNIRDYKDSIASATALVRQFPQTGLAALLVFSDGSLVNGSELVTGLNAAVDHKVIITGGLAGDGAGFQSTLVGLNAPPEEGLVVAIGFYGDKIRIRHGSQGGWDTFGPEREVTRSEGNKLFEIDHKNALELYKKYLGPDAGHLPGSALLFPLAMQKPDQQEPIVRTILSIDNEQQSMTFAGAIPEGSKVRFMKANFDKLTAAAYNAAQHTIALQDEKPAFALLVSCVGRKLILGPRIEEEVEAVTESLGADTPVAGFYSYGEIAPFNRGGDCRLHNQTMTITSFYELA